MSVMTGKSANLKLVLALLLLGHEPGHETLISSYVTAATSPGGAGTPLRSGRKRERVCRESELRDGCQSFDR